MASIKVHEQDCIERLGEPFTHVHLWLDKMAEKYPVEIFQDQHRQYRHHREGVEIVRKKWGNKAAAAAVFHIARDEFDCIPRSFSIRTKEEVKREIEKWRL
jgi:hypothetical protein